jgi:hypothetical protein
MPLGASEEGLVPRPLHPHRPAREPRGEGDVRLDRHVLLAAEAAADVGGHHAHLGVRNAEHLRDVAIVLHDLGRHTDVEDRVVVEPGDAGLGLEVRVVDELRAVLPLDHDVGAREGRLDVTAVDAPLREEVAALVELRGAVGERLVWLAHHGKRVVVDLHRLDRLGEIVLALRDDDRDRFAVEPNAFRREDLHRRAERRHGDGLARNVDPHLVVRHVLAEQHRDDAGELTRPRSVPPCEPRRGNLRSHETRVEHPRIREVAGVSRRARDLLRRVVTGERLVDDAELVRLRRADLVGAHAGRFAPVEEHSSIASTMCW